MVGDGLCFVFKKRKRSGNTTKPQLVPVTLLWKHQCCRDECILMTRTHLNLVAKWRQLAGESRRGLQQAVAELLTPTGELLYSCIPILINFYE